MKKATTLLLVLLSFWANAQLSPSVSPSFPNGDAEITIIFDVSQAKDSRAGGLQNQSDGLYIWAWAGGTTDTKKVDYGSPNKGGFGSAFAPDKLTALGNNKWQIKLTPRQYFGITAGLPIKWLGVLVKTANGSAQTEDVYISLYEKGLQVSFSKPSEKSLFLASGFSFNVVAKASEKATIKLEQDGVLLKTVQNIDSIATTVTVGNVAGQKSSIKVTATTSTETATNDFSYIVTPRPTVAELPKNYRDGINYVSDSKVALSLFAPSKSFVYVIGDFNNWESSDKYLMNRTPDGSRYWIEIDGLKAGDEYAFQYLINGTFAVADPYTDKILDPNNDRFLTQYPSLKTFPAKAQGIVSVLQTAQKNYDWKTKTFVRPAQDNLVIYELLARDFVGTQQYKTLTDTLTYLKKLGINCIELMPIMEFTGNDSWGYNPTFYFAPDKAYGTKNDLKNFIDTCHEKGIAVVLDMVLNQADYENPYVKMYWDGAKPATDSPMFNPAATHPYSVFFDFNHEKDATKTLVDSVNAYWLKEYKFDGFRFDLAKGFTQTNTGNDVGAWGNYDASRVAIWKRIYDNLRKRDASAYVILEFFGGNKEEKELADYGMMLWGNANNAFRSFAKGNGGSINDISYLERNWSKPSLIGYAESHDEERIMWDVLNNGSQNSNYSTRTLKNALDRAKGVATFLLATPGPKMIWQFGELGYDISINYIDRVAKKPTKWEYLQDPDRLRLFKVYAEIIKLKTTQDAFRTADFKFTGNTIKTLVLNHSSMKVFVIGNFDMVEWSDSPNFPNTGKWYDYFTGDEILIAGNENIVLQPGEFHIYTSLKLSTPEKNLTPWSSFTKGIVQTITALPNLPSTEVNIFPNPSSDFLQVNIPSSAEITELFLTDNYGRILIEKTLPPQNQTSELNVSKLASGTYFIQIHTNNISKTIKWIKQ